jgi:hypothetical protein
MSIALPPMRGAISRVLPSVSADMIRTYADKEFGGGVVKHDGLAWLRVRIDMPEDFAGTPEDGWTDSLGRRINLQWSDNLITWHYNKCQTTPEPDTVVDGIRTTYAESIHPQDAQELVVDNVIRWEQPSGTSIIAWQYEQSITLLVLAGVEVSLPNNPYDIPTDAALLQSDLRAAGFDDAVVELDPAELWWEIRAYDLPSDNYYHGPGGHVEPGYTYITSKGDLIDYTTLTGTYPNPRFDNGTSLEPFVIYPRQFIRARITPV